MYTHVYIKSHQAIRMFTYKNTCIRRPVQHLGTKNGFTSLYTTKTKCTSYTTQGASIAPPPTPPSGGGGGPPPPALGGGGPPTGPSCPDDKHPLVIAASTAARCTMARHGGGTPTHYCRKLLS
jgi:hypothetical protein